MAFTVADYIVRRLARQQVDTLFGVPAAYCSPLFDAAIRQGMRTVVTASDLKAGYAADSYARTKGLGAASVAYGVGALSMINAIAGGFVERSPVVVVNDEPTPGALSCTSSTSRPPTRSGRTRPIFPPTSSSPPAPRAPPPSPRCRRRWWTRGLPARSGPSASPTSISTRASGARPVPCWPAPLAVVNRPAGTESALAATIVGLIRAAQSPAILVGQEMQRYGLADKVGDLIAKLGMHWATAVLSKSGGCAGSAGRVDGRGVGRRRPAAMKSGMA